MNAPHSSVLLHQACDGHLGAQRLIDMAFEIADTEARSVIEIYAKGYRVAVAPGAREFYVYSITELSPDEETPVEAMESLRQVQRAAEYIRQRGNVFPWRMVDDEQHPGCVRFVDKEGRPA